MPRKRRLRPPAPLPEEERLLLLQAQALAEEEAAKKKSEMLTQFLKDKLTKEEQSSALNLSKINTQWRAVLRAAKARELRADLEILSQTFARVADCKDSVIQSLARELAEAEAQHGRALCSHLRNVDRLLQLQRCRLRYLREDYDAELLALQRDFELERRAIVEQHKQECSYLQGVMLAVEQNFVENNYEATLNFQSAWDDIKNKQLEEKQLSRLHLGSKVDSLWKQFQQVLHSYTEATEDRKIAFEVLKQKDEKSSKEIEMQTRKLQRLQDSIAAARGRLATRLQESEEQNRQVRRDKDVVLRRLQALKKELARARAEARGGLAALTAQSGAALAALTRAVAKAERILRLAEMCRKLEAEEEKVLPFYACSLGEQEQRDAEQLLQETPAEPLAQALRDYAAMERFWQRFNKAKLEELALAREKAALSLRNGRLRQLLRQYLQGISVSDEVLREPNALLAARPHGPGARPRAREGPTRNLVEAAHVASRLL
ncbi:dynein regulatory complex subunit 2 [Nothoprocta perdicaria]|uniref:dynein regulatory complex subunit 2 n=1 Tax=Nothoprocta perdicaria TaxID=30464 RepID=UPI000E1B6F2F|nr:dynein regulatory complex subunit 2 [Nothoprocta perdicaria]